MKDKICSCCFWSMIVFWLAWIVGQGLVFTKVMLLERGDSGVVWDKLGGEASITETYPNFRGSTQEQIKNADIRYGLDREMVYPCNTIGVSGNGYELYVKSHWSYWLCVELAIATLIIVACTFAYRKQSRHSVRLLTLRKGVVCWLLVMAISPAWFAGSMSKARSLSSKPGDWLLLHERKITEPMSDGRPKQITGKLENAFGTGIIITSFLDQEIKFISLKPQRFTFHACGIASLIMALSYICLRMRSEEDIPTRIVGGELFSGCDKLNL